MKTAFVTGASGFLGSTLVDQLLERGYKVKCAIRKTSNLRWLKDKDIELFYVDFFDKNSIKKAMSGSNYVFHLAGVMFAQSEKEFIDGNITITKNIFQVSLEQDIKLERFLFVSTIVAAGSSKSEIPMIENDEPVPFTWYGKSKYESEKDLLSQGDKIPVTIIRPGAAYGPRDYAMFESFKLSRSGINLIIGKTGKLGSVIHVDDLVNGIINSAESEKTIGEIYFLANDDFIRQEEFGQTVIRAMGKTPKNIILPYGIVKLIAYSCEIYSNIFNKNAVFNQQKFLEFTEPYIICSNKKAKKDFNFTQNISFIKGIETTLEWYKDNKWL